MSSDVEIIIKASRAGEDNWLLDVIVRGKHNPDHVELTNIMLGATNMVLEDE